LLASITLDQGKGWELKKLANGAAVFRLINSDKCRLVSWKFVAGKPVVFDIVVSPDQPIYNDVIQFTSK
jgi:hypothetical protein